MTDNIPYDEKELLSKIADGDEQAFFTLYHQHSARIRTYILKMSGSNQDTEDIIQECFLRIWLKRDQLTEIINISAWINTIAARLCLNYLEKMATRGRLNQQIVIDPLPQTPEEITQLREIRQIIRQVIETLPQPRRDIYALSRKHDLKPAEIAAQLNMPVGTVKNHLTAVNKLIRDILTKSGHNISVIIYFLLKIF